VDRRGVEYLMASAAKKPREYRDQDGNRIVAFRVRTAA